jgi:hypothetical protein
VALLLFEQVWAVVARGESDKEPHLSFLECYDIILRNYSEREIEYLNILSPQSTSSAEPGCFKLIDDSLVPQCRWNRVVKSPTDPSDRTQTVRFHGTNRFVVTPLRPRLSLHPWMQCEPGSTHDFAVTVFRATNRTLASLSFEDDAKIAQFDPEHPEQTTYWIRFAYRPQVVHRVSRPLRFGCYLVQPCEILSPGEVLADLDSRLTFLADDCELREPADEAREAVLHRIFSSHKASLRVEDHRISVITEGNIQLHNPIVEGPCSVLGIQQLKTRTNTADREPAVIRSWLLGAANYPLEDPLHMARAVYRHLVQYGGPYGKTKEELSAAVAFQSHANVSHVVEALVQLKFVERVPNAEKCFRLDKEMPPTHPLLALEPNSQDWQEMGYLFLPFLDALYGKLPVPGRPPSDASSFTPKSVRIHFELAYDARRDCRNAMLSFADTDAEAHT